MSHVVLLNTMFYCRGNRWFCVFHSSLTWFLLMLIVICFNANVVWHCIVMFRIETLLLIMLYIQIVIWLLSIHSVAKANITCAKTSHNSELQHSISPASTPTQSTWMGLLKKDAWGWCWQVKKDHMRTTCHCQLVLTQWSPDWLYKTECVFVIKFDTNNYVRSCSIFGVGRLALDFGRLTCGLGVGRRCCWSVVAGALLLERCCCHAFQLASPFCFLSYGVFCVGMLSTNNSNSHNKR